MEIIQSPNLPNILCCVCSTVIKANAANMCISCLQNEVDVTEGICKEITIYQCRGCLKWYRPPWIKAELESRELLAFCLKKIPGLNKDTKLIDAGWIWTEPHCKRLKIKLTIQKEVIHGAILQQSFIITFIIRNQQCDDCQATFTNSAWKAIVQVRQKVSHKRTFYYLEQIILRYKSHDKATNIESQPDGIDFFFSERSHALRFVDFLQETVPIKIKKAKKLISADNHSNTQNYKFTYAVDIAPVCKDDLVALPLKLARSLGNISPLVLITHVSSSIHVIDPFTLQRAEIDADKYWRYPFKAILSFKSLIPYSVLDSTPVDVPEKISRPNQLDKKNRLSDIEIVRDSDFGINDTKFTTFSHLGNILNVGDCVLGYDLTRAVINDTELEPLEESRMELPDLVLVRKYFPRTIQKRKRNWKLKNIEGIQENNKNGKLSQNIDENEYEMFLNEIEEDKEMRSKMKLYKVSNSIQEENVIDNEENLFYIPIDELLDDLTVEEKNELNIS